MKLEIVIELRVFIDWAAQVIPVRFKNRILNPRTSVSLFGKIVFIAFVQNEEAMLPYWSRVEELTGGVAYHAVRIEVCEADKLFDNPATHNLAVHMPTRVSFRVFVTLAVLSALRWVQGHQKSLRSSGV